MSSSWSSSVDVVGGCDAIVAIAIRDSVGSRDWTYCRLGLFWPARAFGGLNLDWSHSCFEIHVKNILALTVQYVRLCILIVNFEA